MIIKKYYSIAEFIFLFFFLPLFYFWGLISFPMLPTLLLIAAGCLAALLRDSTFPREQLWNVKCPKGVIVKIFLRFFISVPVITFLLLYFAPEFFLSFIRRKPVFWGIVVVCYSFVSVYPQELIYRAFLFHRYRDFFPSPASMVFISAFTFSFMHIVFHNWVAVALTFLGGLLFAGTYQRTRSLFWASLEHYLYGIFLFTVGLGHYFIGGTLSTAVTH